MNMAHPFHPTRHDWHPECPLCWEMVCPDCHHPRYEHSHQQGCLATPECHCRNVKYLAVFEDRLDQ